jgi:hypothetical protein
VRGAVGITGGWDTETAGIRFSTNPTSVSESQFMFRGRPYFSSTVPLRDLLSSGASSPRDPTAFDNTCSAIPAAAVSCAAALRQSLRASHRARQVGKANVSRTRYEPRPRGCTVVTEQIHYTVQSTPSSAAAGLSSPASRVALTGPRHVSPDGPSFLTPHPHPSLGPEMQASASSVRRI